MADVPTRDTCIEYENLKLKEEITMLKTENLKLANDLKIASIFDVEKKKTWEKEAKIALEIEHGKTRLVPQQRGLGYGHASMNQSVLYNVPNVVPQVSTCNGPLGTLKVHPDKKMQVSYQKLQSSEGKGIDFAK